MRTFAFIRISDLYTQMLEEVDPTIAMHHYVCNNEIGLSLPDGEVAFGWGVDPAAGRLFLAAVLAGLEG